MTRPIFLMGSVVLMATLSTNSTMASVAWVGHWSPNTPAALKGEGAAVGAEVASGPGMVRQPRAAAAAGSPLDGEQRLHAARRERQLPELAGVVVVREGEHQHVGGL